MKLYTPSLKKLGSAAFPEKALLFLLGLQSLVNNNDFKKALTQRKDDKKKKHHNISLLDKIERRNDVSSELRDKISQIKQCYATVDQTVKNK